MRNPTPLSPKKGVTRTKPCATHTAMIRAAVVVPPPSPGSLQRILPAGVIAVEHWGFGCEQDLLPEEAEHVKNAVSKRRLEIGIDAEQVGAVDPSLWPAVCIAEEHAWLLSEPEARRPELATKFFCAKEAFYKCQYAVTGQWLDFHDVAVTIAADTFDATASAVHGGLSATGAFWIGNGIVLAALAVRRGTVGQ
jgi:hypothetical protein